MEENKRVVKENSGLRDKNESLVREKNKIEGEKDEQKEKFRKSKVNDQMELQLAHEKSQDAIIKEKKEVQEKLKNVEDELKVSNANVNALVGQKQVREREKDEMESKMNKMNEDHASEMQSKQSEINRLLNTQLKNEKAKVEKIESSLEQVRDENAQVKNQLKEVRQNGGHVKAQSHYDEFQIFKKQVTKDIEDLRKIAFERGNSWEGSVNVGDEKKGAKKKKKRKKKALSTQEEKEAGTSNQNQRKVSEETVSSSSSEEEDGYESGANNVLVEQHDEQKDDEVRNRNKTLIISTSITRDIQPASL